MVLLLVIVKGCSEFNGTVFDMIKVRQQAKAYVHNKYQVPFEHMETDVPDYFYGTFRYYIQVYDTKNGDIYLLSIRIRSNDYEDIEEPEGNPISSGDMEKKQ
mgnify:CR=1 FL=1